MHCIKPPGQLGDRRDFRALAAVVIPLLLAACGVSNDGDSNRAGQTLLAPNVARIKTTPQAVLRAGASDRRTPNAVALDEQLQPMQADAAWISSDPASVTVDENGTVRAAAAVGTARITAIAGAVQSEPVYVSIARPVAGAQLLSESQVVLGPAIVDPTAEPSAVVLRGVPAPAVGSILIAV
jgi:hypothetical protein